MDLTPNVVSMLVYIDVASVEKSKASPGMDKKTVDPADYWPEGDWSLMHFWQAIKDGKPVLLLQASLKVVPLRF
jgi:hypothetical protein